MFWIGFINQFSNFTDRKRETSILIKELSLELMIIISLYQEGHKLNSKIIINSGNLKPIDNKII